MNLDSLHSSPNLVCLTEVEPREVRWLWPGWIPFGKLTVLEGDPGAGKSALLLGLAAQNRAWRNLAPF
jgi:archaellum biogenesis ATPase FlaH